MPFSAWRRVPESGACPWCLMLATRGAVYKSKTTAKTARGKSSYHRHCKCRAELETRFDQRTDIRTDPADAAAVVRIRQYERDDRYDLSKYRNLGITDPPQPPRHSSATRGTQPAVDVGRPVVETGGAGGGQPPSRPLLTPAGPDEPAVFAVMDAAFEQWARDLTEAQRTALNEWQKTTRFYESVQAYLRGTAGVNPQVQAQLEGLLEAVRGGRVAIDVPLFRGLRDWSTVFGSLDPETTAPAVGLLATTIDARVALKEFAKGRNPALLRLYRREACPAAWVAGVGDPSLRYQGEILMPENANLRILRLSGYSGDVPMVDVEVWW